MMSKEAKIGLLFSLVFIVAIAVILRSVHEETINSSGKNDIMAVDTNNRVNNNLSSIVGELTYPRPGSTSGTQSATGRDGATQSRGSLVSNEQGTKPSALDEHLQPVKPVSQSAVSDQGQIGKPIYTMGLPKPDNVVSVNTAGSGTNSNVEKAIGVIGDGSVEVVNIQPKKFTEYDKIRDMVEHGPLTIDVAPSTQTDSSSKSVVHVVGNGESLTTIAMKYYGKKEGNRLVNIKKIYEANKDILSSINAVKVGQRLSIPQLEGVVITQETQGAALKPVVNEKPALIDNVDTSAHDRFYTVKDKDSLWKIAQRELGNGTRYTEIIKLNSKVLKNNDDLSVGMKLVLPAK